MTRTQRTGTGYIRFTSSWIPLIALVFFFASSALDRAWGQNVTSGAQGVQAAPVINVWNGNTQPFGKVGIPQTWVNILGNVTAGNGLSGLSYSLNGGGFVSLSVGPDMRRLGNANDFNIDIPFTSLGAGSNNVAIRAVDNLSLQTTVNISVVRTTGRVWPRTYVVRWSNGASLMDSAQVVDGHWQAGSGEVRILEPGYDRLVAIGDVTWTDYEITTKVLLHWVDNSAEAFGDVSGGPAIGFLMRWNGHTDQPTFSPPISQPLSGYLPYGALGWFHFRNYNFNGLSDRWELMGNNLQLKSESASSPLSVGVVYIFKMRVKNTAGVGGLYSFKAWPDGSSEPAGWMLTGQESLSDPQHGSVALIAHHVDVSFGEVTVTPLGDVTAPTLLSPANGATDIVNGSTLTWQSVDAAAWYQVQVSTEPSFTSGLQIDQSWLDNVPFTLSGLASATTYYWRVRGYNTDTGGPFSGTWSFSTPLQPPVPKFPALNAVNQPTSLTLQWSKVNSSTYGVQVATDSTFGSGIIVNVSGLTDSTRFLSGLSTVTRYFWRVNAKVGASTSPYSIVAAFNTTLATPLLSSPVDQSTNRPVNLTLLWRKVTGATAYRLQLATDPAFVTGIFVDDNTLTDTTRAVAGLATYTRYFWRVQARNANGTGSFSSASSFLTTLAVPTLLLPPNGGGGLGTTAFLRWRGVGGAQQYHVQIATDAAFLTGFALNDSTIVDTSMTAVGLLNNMQYYWRVRGRNVDGNGSFTSAWTFSTLLAAPAQLSPQNGTNGLPTSLTIRWTRVVNATAYHLQLGTDSTFTLGLVKNDSTIIDSQRVVSGINIGTRYFWHVRARNAGGGGVFSPTWNFRTQGTFPSPVVLESPVFGALANRATVTFVWQRSAPAISKYWFELSTDSTFSLRVVDSAVVDTQHVHGGLSDGDYWWRVRAANIEGWGPFSENRALHVKITGVALTEGLPVMFALDQNYPNPFNPSTRIGFDLPRSGMVLLEIINPLGQIVHTLVDGVVAAGRHQVTFQAEGLPGGLYFYRLRYEQTVVVRKMVLLK